MNKRVHYQAYMLRMWHDQSEPGDVWRASLESPHTGERRCFVSLEALFDFLKQRIGPSAQSSKTDGQAASEVSK